MTDHTPAPTDKPGLDAETRLQREQLRVAADLRLGPGGNCQRGAHGACMFPVDCPCECHDTEVRPLLDALAAAEAARDAAVAERDALRERVAALIDAEVAADIATNVSSAVAGVRCLDCNLRYEERQEYGCHESGRGHSYDDEDIADAERAARQDPINYVMLPVSDLRAALADAEPAEVPRCPKCRHAPHGTLGFCPNMASDNDCACTYTEPAEGGGER